MKSSWKHVRHAPEHRSPVEMRFVDMFMTALGSLIFLALLLSVLVAYIDKSGIAVTPPEKGQAALTRLRLLTRILPAARVDDPYELVLAHRGGTEPLKWSVIAGRGGIPSGIAFDEERGSFAGTPLETGSYPVTVIVVDSKGVRANASYNLNVAPRTVSAQEVNLLIATVLLLALLWFARKSRQRVKVYGVINKMAADAKARGQLKLELRFSPTHHQQRELNEEGFREIQSDLAQSRRTFRLELLAAAIAAAYLAWALWKAETALSVELVNFVRFRWPGLLLTAIALLGLMFLMSRRNR
jgi:hypothetical protein